MKFIELLLKLSRKNISKQYKTVSLILGGIFFLTILPGIFVAIGFFVKSYIIINLDRTIEFIVSIIGIIAGLCFLIWSAIIQWKFGNGTPAPNAPTQNLIIVGPYKYCRNPIEFGAILYYLGIGTFIGGIIVGIISSLLGFTVGSIYNKFIEEKELEGRFGEEYKKYKEKIPFLFPKIGIKN
jgi:protein-S-isoprenylcysteine O-methyltransferase Ste14